MTNIQTRTKKIKLGLILTLIILVGITYHSGVRASVKNTFYVVTEPLQSCFREMNSSIAEWEVVFNNFKYLQTRIEKLERQKLKLLSETSKLEQIRKENEFLRKTLELEPQKDFKLQLVRVISKSPSQDQILVDKGFQQGVKKGMVVIDEQKSVWGKVTQAGEDFSRVTLTSHPDSKFSAKVKGKEIKGEIVGQGNLGLKFDLIPQGVKVNSGQVIITSILGKSFPQGLIVGKIQKVRQKDVKPFQQAQVEPYFDMNNSFLFIITDY